MPNVSAWLQGLGLGKYAPVFEEHEIDFDALPHLTEAMLEKLGLPIGPRAKLLAAISQLVPHSRRNQHSEEPARPRQEERRQITVMFCDVVDSTKLTEILDPEDLGSVIRAYQRACGGIIARYGGQVARYFGDGIMAYFGWPAAHEDAAERAVRAGLEVVEAVKQLASPEKLLVRVGVSTGIVVIGEQGPGDPAKLADAVGGAPYVAARIQNFATPNSVVIAEATSRLVSGRFDQEDLGLQNLKGLTQPVRAFRIQRVRDDSSRFQAVHTKALTPLVGRETELAILQQRWRNAQGGDGQVVFVSGVPGIGKSRIVHELEKSIRGEPHCSLSFQCLPHCMESPLFPITQQIKSLADLATEDSIEVKLDKIETLVGLATEQIDRVAPFIAALLSIPSESRYAPFALTAQQVKDQTLFILIELLLGLAAEGPVFCLVEDAHWIDPSTQELLDLVVSQIEKARILLLVTHRPEYTLRSTMQSNVSGLTLSRLGRGEVVEMTRLALRHQTVSSTAIERIIDESDAIPLFVEELARGVIERGGINGHGTNGQSTKLSASWSVPESLRDSLVARLDRAPQARNVAQMAAVMGREFSYDMLLQVSSLTNSELDAALSHLKQSEIVQVIDSRPLPRYAFKHALVRDAAYESLLKSSRREIHAKVCSIIEKDRPEIVADQPELLAYHYSLAGDPESAVRYWLLGGKRARSRSANLEAAGQLRRALEILELLPNTLERMRTKLEIHLLLGLCFIAVRGYQADDTRNAFEVARGLSAELAEPHKEFQAIYGLWGHHWMRAYHDRAIELSETLVAKAQLLNEPITLIVGYRCLGSTLFTLGDFVGAKEHLERAIALSQLEDIDESSLSYGPNPRVAAQLMLAWDLWMLGYPEQALHHVLHAVARATVQADPYSVAFAHYVTSAVQLFRGEAEESLRHAEQSLAIARDHRIHLYTLYSQFGRGCALGKMGHQEQAIAEIQAGIQEARRSNLGYLHGFMLEWLARLQADAGDLETALSTIDEAFRHINDVAGRAWEAELHRLRGDILLMAHPDGVEEAERSYNDAICVAQRQRARSFELRAIVSLARLLQRQGRSDEARRLLGSVYGWFTEGFDTADLKEAKALLEFLG